MLRVKKSVIVCVQGRVKALIMPRLSKRLHRFTKKVPGTVRARACRRTVNPAIFTVWGLVTTVYR